MPAQRKRAAVRESSASLMPAVTISRRAVERLHSGHVWVYKSDIAAPEKLPPEATNAPSLKYRALPLPAHLNAAPALLVAVVTEMVDEIELLLPPRL